MDCTFQRLYHESDLYHFIVVWARNCLTQLQIVAIRSLRVVLIPVFGISYPKIRPNAVPAFSRFVVTSIRIDQYSLV